MPAWLDPAQTAEAGTHPDPPSELPPRVRKFGFIPSLELLRAGDLLLVSAVDKPWVSRAIVTVQKQAGFDDETARWHHSAVYLGNGLVCEALLTGAKALPIHKYVAGTHCLKFRRAGYLSDLDSCKLALEAALKLKYRYNFASILQLYFQAKNGWKTGNSAPRKLSSRATICSQLFADAYGVVSKNTLDSTAVLGVSPAHLAVNRTLSDIPMRWLSIPKSEEAAPGSR